jgi:hypothetical protein
LFDIDGVAIQGRFIKPQPMPKHVLFCQVDNHDPEELPQIWASESVGVWQHSEDGLACLSTANEECPKLLIETFHQTNIELWCSLYFVAVGEGGIGMPLDGGGWQSRRNSRRANKDDPKRHRMERLEQDRLAYEGKATEGNACRGFGIVVW